MKRFYSLLLFFVIIINFSQANSTFAAENIPGDLDGNGNISAHDVIRGLQLLSGSFNGDLSSGDVHDDGIINMADILYSLRVNTLDWGTDDGLYGSPTSSFTLPGPKSDGGIYYSDIQASFPDVNWQTLDRLYIPAGHYKYIFIQNLPSRESNNRLVITNFGGQVRVGGLGHYYCFGLGGGSNWVLTGRFDPESQTGDAAYPGHRDGNFSHSQGTYGILIDDELGENSTTDFSGLSVSSATEFEIEFLEVRKTSFAGMSIKTNDDADAHMEKVILHDNYIHDTASEGLYIGSTQSAPQHQIRDWKIYNNRILRTGTEALQLGQLAGHTQVYNNVIGPAAIDWRAAFHVYQDSNLQLGVRTGHVDIHHNIFIGSANSMISLFAQSHIGDETTENVGVTFRDNYFDGFRFLGMYANSTSLPNMAYRFERNQFRGYRFERDEVYDVAKNNHLLRSANTTTPLIFIDNIWSDPENLNNILLDGNGSVANASGSGNTKTEPERIYFINSGLDIDFDYLQLEMWTDVATLGGDVPVTYEQGDIVMYGGLPYLCTDDPCASGLLPPNHPDTWQAMPEFPDDVRVMPGTIWDELGLSPALF